MVIKDFQYDTNNDQKVFCHAKINLKDINLEVQACSFSGSKDGKTRKPNEDALSLLNLNDSIIAAVFDGSSSLKPIKSLKDQTGARFASHFLKETLEKGNKEFKVKEILRALNKKLLLKTLTFEGASLNDIHTLPASTATLVQLFPNSKLLQISHVGDSFCMIVFKDGHSEFVTIDRNKKYDDEILHKMKRISDEKHISPRKARQDPKIVQALIDMFQDSFNKPDGTGQGLITGDPNAVQYFQDISFSFENVQSILLGTDGLIPLAYDEQKKVERQKIFQIINENGLEGLIKKKVELENNDPDWHLLRYKHSDDATGIFIQINSSE